jgi:hypothetical protein
MMPVTARRYQKLLVLEVLVGKVLAMDFDWEMKSHRAEPLQRD